MSAKMTKAEILHRCEILEAALAEAKRPPVYRPIERIDLARLIACETPEAVAGWVVDRLCPAAMKDESIRDTVGALQAYGQTAALFARARTEGES